MGAGRTVIPGRRVVCWSTLLIALAGPAWAQQQAAGTGPEEIVVTAEKRQSTVQETPISVTALTGDQLAAEGTTRITSVIEETPGLSMRSAGPGQTEIEARGLASSGGSSPTVGFYLDDTPLSPPAAAQVGKVVIDPDLFDLNRVEVLRGPQGTLYGSGSMGGTIKLVTNQPDPSGFSGAVEGILSGTEGGGANPGGNVMLNVPLSDSTALRLVGTDKFRDGWIDRVVLDPFPLETGTGCPPFYGCQRGNVLGAPVQKVVSDVNTELLEGARASLLSKPLDGLTLEATVMYQRISQGGYDEYDLPPGAAELAHYQAFNIKEPVADTFRLYTFTASYDLGWATLSNDTSYWSRELKQTQDASESLQTLFGQTGFLPVPYTEVDPSRQLSEELRLASNGNGPIGWLGGFFYSDLHSTWIEISSNPGYAFLSPPGTNPEGVVFNADNPYHISQYALFGEGSYALPDDLKLTMGLRYYRYRTSVDNTEAGITSPTGMDVPFLQHASSTDDGFNPKFNLAYTPDPDLTVYATASKGYRPGGVNISVPVAGPGSCLPGLQAIGLNQVPLSYGPDSVWNYELGEKARLWDERLSVNGDFYYMDWQGVQQIVNLPCGYVYTANAGTAHSFGPELEITARLLPELTVTANGTYIDSQIDKAAAHTGLAAPLPVLNVPHYTGSLSVTYSRPVMEDYAWVTRLANQYVGPSTDASFAYVDLPAYDLVNFRTGLVAEHWTAAFFIDNLTDKRAALSENNTSFQFNIPSLTRVSTNQPRTFGVDVTYRF